jgi:hypothetical protein
MKHPLLLPPHNNPTSVSIATRDLLKKFGHATCFLKELRIIVLENIKRHFEDLYAVFVAIVDTT